MSDITELAKRYSYPVWGTQGGGLVKSAARGRYVFIEAPDCPGLDVGDFMPEEWGIIPANDAAQDEGDGSDGEYESFESDVADDEPPF